MGIKRKKNSAAQNWVLTSNRVYSKVEGDKALNKLKSSRSGKKFKLIPNPNGKGMIEVEVKDDR